MYTFTFVEDKSLYLPVLCTFGKSGTLGAHSGISDSLSSYLALTSFRHLPCRKCRPDGRGGGGPAGGD